MDCAKTLHCTVSGGKLVCPKLVLSGLKIKKVKVSDPQAQNEPHSDLADVLPLMCLCDSDVWSSRPII